MKISAVHLWHSAYTTQRFLSIILLYISRNYVLWTWNIYGKTSLAIGIHFCQFISLSCRCMVHTLFNSYSSIIQHNKTMNFYLLPRYHMLILARIFIISQHAPCTVCIYRKTMSCCCPDTCKSHECLCILWVSTFPLLYNNSCIIWLSDFNALIVLDL